MPPGIIGRGFDSRRLHSATPLAAKGLRQTPENGSVNGEHLKCPNCRFLASIDANKRAPVLAEIARPWGRQRKANFL